LQKSTGVASALPDQPPVASRIAAIAAYEIIELADFILTFPIHHSAVAQANSFHGETLMITKQSSCQERELSSFQ
jgi:hypothetical protein